jgi:hypothetical protein
LDETQREAFRSHGRLLAAALLAHLDTTDSIRGDHQLNEATAHAATYGRMVAELGVSLSQAVEGFLQFRRPFLTELSAVAVRRGFDAAGTTDLMDAAERAMDRLLIAAMTAFSVRQVGGLTRGGRSAVPERAAPARP